MLGEAFTFSLKRVQRPVSLAIFEDVKDVFDLYVARFGRLNGVTLKCHATIDNADEAIKIFRRSRPSIVITDLSLGEKANTAGFTIVNMIKGESPRTAVALATLHTVDSVTDIEERIKAQPFDAVFHKTDFIGISAFITRKVGEFQREPLEHSFCLR